MDPEHNGFKPDKLAKLELVIKSERLDAVLLQEIDMSTEQLKASSYLSNSFRIFLLIVEGVIYGVCTLVRNELEPRLLYTHVGGR